MLLWAAKLHIMYADLSSVLFVNPMDAIKMMMMILFLLLYFHILKHNQYCKAEISVSWNFTMLDASDLDTNIFIMDDNGF